MTCVAWGNSGILGWELKRDSIIFSNHYRYSRSATVSVENKIDTAAIFCEQAA